MASRLGPVEITCEAPPYAIVRACEEAGFWSPLDVRWRRMGRFLDQGKRRHALPGFSWLSTLGLAPPEKVRCACGADLPDLAAFEFRHEAQVVGKYVLGQCTRCWTMFWEEA